AMDKMRLADVGQFDRTPSPIDGIARTLGYRKLPGYGLYIVSAVDRGNVFKEWFPSILIFGTLALAAAVALLLTATAVVRHARREEDALRRGGGSGGKHWAPFPGEAGSEPARGTEWVLATGRGRAAGPSWLVLDERVG